MDRNHAPEQNQMDIHTILRAHEKNLQAKSAGMTQAEKSRAYALQMLDAEYAWGKEYVFGSDCSGTAWLAADGPGILHPFQAATPYPRRILALETQQQPSLSNF